MIGNKFMTWTAAFAIALGLSYFTLAMVAGGEQAVAEEAAETPRPTSPLKAKSVDYVDVTDGTGTLKMSGIAIPSKELYVYVDDEPLVRVITSADGKWSVEEKVSLDDKVHKVRLEQFDDKTRMLAARAMFSMSVPKPGADGKAPAKP